MAYQEIHEPLENDNNECQPVYPTHSRSEGLTYLPHSQTPPFRRRAIRVPRSPWYPLIRLLKSDRSSAAQTRHLAVSPYKEVRYSGETVGGVGGGSYYSRAHV